MPPTRKPIIYVIGGPNGAGKTTFAREFLPAAHVVEFLNLDLLAAGLSPLQPEAMAVRSARLLLTRWKELVELKRDFAFETTLSGRTYAPLLRQARAAGCEIRLFYLWLPNVSTSIRRVRQRVRKGGHDVPEADLRRRFLPSLKNFFNLYLPLANDAMVWNATANPPSIIARWQSTACTIFDPECYERIKRQIQTADKKADC